MILDPQTIDRVLELLRAEPGFEAAELAAPPEPIGGGFWATMRLLRLRNVDPSADSLVLRVMPDAALALKEAVIQKEIERQGFPVPAVRLVGGPDSGMGGSFMLMDRAPGHPPLEGLDPRSAIRRLPYLARSLPDLLAAVSARLHRLDAKPLRSALSDSPQSAATNPTEFLEALIEATSTFDRTDLAMACHSLAQTQPTASKEVICHGDLHPFNLLVDNGHWTLIDWTTGLIADPGYDLAFTRLMLRHPPMAAPSPFSHVIDFAGAILARRFLLAYEGAGEPLPLPAVLGWFTSLHALRALVEVEWWKIDGTVAERRGHPWMVIGPAAARTVTRNTGITVAWRPE